MSWLEWVASNAYEGGVIDSMTSTRATFAKLSVFGFFANFIFLNIVPGQAAYFCERVRPTPRLSPLACRGEVKYNFRVLLGV